MVRARVRVRVRVRVGVRVGAMRTVREHKVDAGRKGEDVCGEAGVLKAGGSAHARPDGEHTVPTVGGGVAAEEGVVVCEALPATARVLQVEGV